MTVRIADVWGHQTQPLGRLTEALDQIEAGEMMVTIETPVKFLNKTGPSSAAEGTARMQRSAPVWSISVVPSKSVA